MTRVHRALLALSVSSLLLIGNACGGDDGDGDAGARPPSEVEDLATGQNDPTVPTCDEALLTLEDVNEASGLEFVSCDGYYKTADGVVLDLQHTVSADAEEASSYHEGFAGTSPISGDGWEGAERDGLIMASRDEHFFSVASKGSSVGQDVLRNVLEVLIQSTS